MTPPAASPVTPEQIERACAGLAAAFGRVVEAVRELAAVVAEWAREFLPALQRALGIASPSRSLADAAGTGCRRRRGSAPPPAPAYARVRWVRGRMVTGLGRA